MPAERDPRDSERSDPPTEAELRSAYRQATKTAARTSLLGALGFGAALLMLVVLVQRGPTPSPTPLSLEHMLIFGGVFGGILFTVIASRASRTAKRCERQLEDAD
jgi:hypothetical protein